jgi:hypothetical protein
MKKFTVFVFVMVLTNVPISCNFGCGPFTPLEARITDLSASVGTLDSSSDFSTVKSTDFNTVAIEVMISNMDYSEMAAIEKRINFSFVAFACSPPEPQPTQTIESIELFSNESIFTNDGKFEAGESLNELFNVTKYSVNIETISIAEYIEVQQEYLEHFAYFGDNIVFQLKEKPDSIINQTIFIEFEFSNEESISVETDLFEVSN